jgi:MoxR-like ATPase
MVRNLPTSIDETSELLGKADYLPDRRLATAVFLALSLGRPLLLEGEPGTGKTEVAKALASALGRRLLRLQCYEGLDLASAAYEWNYAGQLLEIRLAEASGVAQREQLARSLFDERFLIRRPLLQSIEPDPAGPPVLLIDELDRADEPFEAYLLELLSDFQITIPELGTRRALAPPIVILTSNRTREIHDAVTRRCIYHWVGFPDAARELQIVRRRVPGIEAALAARIVAFVHQLRELELFKQPGVAESIEWSRALAALDAVSLDPAMVDDTLGVVLKYQDDLERVRGAQVERILAGIDASTSEQAADA